MTVNAALDEIDNMKTLHDQSKVWYEKKRVDSYMRITYC